MKRQAKPRIVLPITVYEAAIGRIRWLWDEFDGQMSVSFSGGKDSTVVLELAAQVAREHGARLRVNFLDQEAEWQGTRDYLRHLKDTREELDFHWYQVPFRLFNAASHEDEWGMIWEPGHPDDWYMRQPEPDSIRENTFGVDRFTKLLEAINTDSGGVSLTGMRAEESPNRAIGVTVYPTYKWATWGSRDPSGKNKYVLMHPIYDWKISDVWKAIHDGGWDYNRVYDEMFRYGTPIRDMRVSSLIHSGSVRSIEQIQEIEPETWENLSRRFPGTNAASHVGEDSLDEFRGRKPQVFDTWMDYLTHLIENLVKEEHRPKFYSQIEKAKKALPWLTYDRVAQNMIPSVMKNDYWDTYSFKKWVKAEEQRADRIVQAGGKLEPDSVGAIER